MPKSIRVSMPPQSPSSSSPRQLLLALLKALGAPELPRVTTDRCLHEVLRRLKHFGIERIVVDEFHGVERGSEAKLEGLLRSLDANGVTVQFNGPVRALRSQVQNLSLDGQRRFAGMFSEGDRS
jgi:hypothetical protein